MKTHSNYLLIAIIVFTMVTCKNNNQTEGIRSNDNTILLSLDMDENETIDFTEQIDSIRFIRLDNSEECLIGKIQKVIFHEGRYYIQDNKAGSIFVFDETGKFQCKISQKGQGPGEYVNITRLLIDYNRKQILIYDGTLRKMLYYTLDCKHIKDIPHFCNNAIIRDVIQLPNGSFLCYAPDYREGKTKRGIWTVDSTGKFDKMLWEATIQYPFAFHEHMSYFYELKDNKIGLWCADYNDILHFSHGSLYKYLSIKINMKTSTDYPGYDIDNTPYQYTMDKTNVMEKDNFVLIDWWNHNENNGMSKSSLYLKNENKVIVSTGIKYGEDFIPAYHIPFNRTDQMITAIYAHNAEYLLNSKYTSEKNKSILRSMFSEQDEDNPILEIVYLKK
jgi:hypothetical protein